VALNGTGSRRSDNAMPFFATISERGGADGCFSPSSHRRFDHRQFEKGRPAVLAIFCELMREGAMRDAGDQEHELTVFEVVDDKAAAGTVRLGVTHGAFGPSEGCGGEPSDQFARLKQIVREIRETGYVRRNKLLVWRGNGAPQSSQTLTTYGEITQEMRVSGRGCNGPGHWLRPGSDPCGGCAPSP